MMFEIIKKAYNDVSFGFLRRIGARIGITNLVLLSPLLMGSLSELARAGDSLSVPIHYCIALLAFVIILAAIEFSPLAGVLTMTFYVVGLGWMRRGLIPSTGYIPNDPITLVSTFVGGVFFLRLVLMRKIPRDTPISQLMIYLIGWMLLEILNPLQGGIQVGIGGAIFRIAPIFWYYVGLTRGSRVVLKSLFITTIGLSFIQVAEGYRQMHGLSDVEKYWTIINSGATQVVAKDVFRSFGTFLSFSEYVIFINMAAVLCWVLFLQRKYIYIIPFCVLFVAIVLSSSRGAVLGLVSTMIVVWGVQGKTFRNWIPRLLVAAVIGGWGLVLGIGKVSEIEVQDRSTDLLLTHQIKGLSDPLGKESTGGLHLEMIVNGVKSGVINPLGKGLGAGTIASGKFGGSSGSTEADFSDMFVALGIVGGVLYIVICIRIWKTVGTYWLYSRDQMALCVMALLTVSMLKWLVGGHYSQSIILWLSIGTVDRLYKSYSGRYDGEGDMKIKNNVFV